MNPLKYLIQSMLGLGLFVSLPVSASSYAQFLEGTFGKNPPQVAMLWLKKETKAVLSDEYDYVINRLRVRYWHRDRRTAWILEEVGKEQPITMGVVVNGDHIEAVEVLEYRESRGDEIQYPFFRDQYRGVKLIQKKGKYRLDKNIDGITGATLSVQAMTKVTKVALFFHQLANSKSQI